MWALEIFQITAFFRITYFYLIDGFGDVSGLATIYCTLSEISTNVGKTGISLRSFNELQGTKVILAYRLSIVRTALIAFNIGQAITCQAASALACDIVITISLIRSLSRHKGNIRSTNTMLDALMVNAVNRGALTAVCALLNLVLFLVLPGTFYYFIGLELSGKLYMNSALATLNSRKHIVKTAHETNDTCDWNSTPLSDLEPRSMYRGNGHVRVVVSHQYEDDNDHDMVNSKTSANLPSEMR
ncbi:hypothetical protein D9619_008520 [Psilocybe cf. subviscida]|uniref:DUF6534 domain-containing protein n=1 Tax=Psilocybe cf. subviscida TaxID=2480587 RepID=A0A8H5BA18_9AGAR|nr:hypothetical protein D9619_008520 [Psilocybe cf. subviscida]